MVHCGLDARFFLRTCMPVPDRPRLVNVGRLSEQKGQLLLVEAAARLRERGVEFELVIVGDGPMRGEIEAAHRAVRPAAAGPDHRLFWTTMVSARSCRPPGPWYCPALPRDCRW